jgi:hypothetical protein
MTSAPDIILGVARAADSVKQREVASRLERMGGQVAPASEASAPVTDLASDSSWSSEVRRAGTDTTTSAAYISRAAGADGPDKTSEVHVQFEALLLQNMVEAMMPEDSEALTGSGLAGKMWKSMLAEKIAAEIARTGTIGIAKQIASGPGISPATAPPAQFGVDKT